MLCIDLLSWVGFKMLEAFEVFELVKYTDIQYRPIHSQSFYKK